MANVLETLRKQNKADLIDLVKMHLSFLIEVTAEEWQQIVAYVDKELEEDDKMAQQSLKLSGNNNGKQNQSQTKYFTSTSSSSSVVSETSSTTGASKKFGPPKEKELASNIFGKPLTNESLRQVMLLVNFLNEEDNYKLEGIFRKSGTQERQQDLRFMLNNGVRVDLKANRFTPVDTSCVLKEFIQNLPEPLLTVNHFELHFELAKAIRSEIPESELLEKNAKRLKIVQLLLHLLPELNRTFFMSVMALLNKVARAIDVTKMDERSLATIFGQHILCPRSWAPKQVQKNIEIITDAMEFLLLNYDRLFYGPKALVLDAKKKLNKRKAHNLSAGEGGDSLNSNRHNLDDDDEGDENNTVLTFCQRKQSQDTITDQALAELYAQVQSMPDTPHKKKLIKQFNRQNGCGTPMQKDVKSSSKWKSLLPPILRPLKH
uniref:Rho GTPase-activating protein 19 n=1 Tax=Aceria tosichella TaxID=561515 RepID=A0A6G1SI36_9ACAR